MEEPFTPGESVIWMSTSIKSKREPIEISATVIRQTKGGVTVNVVGKNGAGHVKTVPYRNVKRPER
jgi:hypothetical protein